MNIYLGAYLLFSAFVMLVLVHKFVNNNSYMTGADMFQILFCSFFTPASLIVLWELYDFSKKVLWRRKRS